MPPSLPSLSSILSLTLTTLTLLTSSTQATATSPKRGLAYNKVEFIKNFHGPNTQITWAYNWDSLMASDFPQTLEYVPMLEDGRKEKVDVWHTNAQNALNRGSGHLMYYNEPELRGTPADVAARDYPVHMHPFRGKASLGGPSIDNDPSKGLVYLVDFLARCNGCQIDFIPVHWYDSCNNIGWFKDFMQRAYNAGGHRPIWLTEFACKNGDNNPADEATMIAFLKEVLPWLDSTPWIERYAWFMADHGLHPELRAWITNQDTNPNGLGNVYAYSRS